MEPRNQKATERLQIQMPERLEEHKDKGRIRQPYRSPEMFLVGSANSLVAAYPHGNDYDNHGQYYTSL